jgi:hypothetical protein
LGILRDQGLELLIAGGVLAHHGDLVGGNIPGEGFAVFSALEVVIGAVGAVAEDTEFARFHLLDLADLLEDLRGFELIHGQSIYVSIHFSTKKAVRRDLPEIRLAPSADARSILGVTLGPACG